MTRLFDKVPEELFSPLSRKYKSIYSYALICLYHLLKTHKNDIKRSDYVMALKSQGDELLQLFNVDTDRLDDKDESENVEVDTFDQDNLSIKVNYIVRKLAKCGWYIISKNPKTSVEYLYIPAYAIQFMRLIDDITSDVSSYLPLVHQTYAELKMEDEREDDYMYRSLMNARANADALEMSVILLRQQICVFGNRLTTVLDPNVALRQHFDEYRVDIADKYYHPMKTFDSLGLYSQPTIAILNRWIKSERIITMLVKEAKAEPINRKKDNATLTKYIIKTIQDVIDIFSRLANAFNEIDAANANYTEAVQKKVNYLSATDKTVKGKIDKIMIALANEIKNNPALSYEEMPLVSRAKDTVVMYRQGYVDSSSLTMPFKRSFVPNSDPLPMEDVFAFDDDAFSLNSYLDAELDRFSDAAIQAFIESNMGEEKQITTLDMKIESADQLVLYILGILKSLLGLLPYEVTKVADRIEYANYYMPQYKFVRKKMRR